MMAAQRMFGGCAALLALWVSGCGVQNPQAQFALRPTTRDLIPAASKQVQTTLVDHFGTPDNLVAWGRLPVNYGGVKGVVAAPAEGVSLQPGQIAVEWSAATDGIRPKDPVLWLSGPLAASADPTDTVKSFDPATGVLSLERGGDVAPGAELSVGFGQTMQLGRVAYMRNCHHCHGVAGDGEGPTAKFLNPKPRDYRLGVFKFTSTNSMSKITRDDLHRIIKYGIPGTYMPSFLLLDEAETVAIIEYVRWLAMRGELEKRLDDELAGDYSLASIDDAVRRSKASSGDGEKPASRSQLLKKATDDFKEYQQTEFATVLNETADMLADLWTQAEDPANVITPSVPRVADTPESRARGKLLYLSDKAKCYTCHGPLGKGDGAATEDFWPKPGSTEKYEKRGLHDVWGNPLPPRDLTKGQYRGGRRPIDVFRRIHAGIKGTPMPAFGGTVLKDEDIWDVVNYVMSIPFEPPSPSRKAPAALAQTDH